MPRRSPDVAEKLILLAKMRATVAAKPLHILVISGLDYPDWKLG